MKFNLNLTETLDFQSNTDVPNLGDDNLTLLDLQLLEREVESFTGDDWLSLCPDIDSGELYRNWFIYYDADVTEAWEAYDYLTDYWFEAEDLLAVKTRIDAIENSRSDAFIAA